MADEVDQALADHIYGLDKEIRSDWCWSNEPGGMVETVNVFCIDDRYDLTMKGWRSTVVPSEFSYSLNYQGAVEIRRWEPRGTHENPNGEIIRGSHKHMWTETGEGDRAYSVNDVNTSNVYQALRDFCDECEIDFKGSYQRSLANGKL